MSEDGEEIKATDYSSEINDEIQLMSEEEAQLDVEVYTSNRNYHKGRERTWVGTKGQGQRLEAFRIDHVAIFKHGLFYIEYMAHIQDIGDTPWHLATDYLPHSYGYWFNPGGLSSAPQPGFLGKTEKRIEGFAIRIKAGQLRDLDKKFDICYAAHLKDLGDTAIHRNGEFCGTRGQNRRVEAIYVYITKR